MPAFKYRAINKKGEKIEGNFIANNENEVLAMIRGKEYYPVLVKKTSQRKKIDLSYIFSKVKKKDVAVLCRQLSTLLNAGLDILNCVHILRQQTENKKLTFSLNEIYEDIQRGSTLSEAMNKYNNIYPQLLINMIEAGEATGSLNNVVEKMAQHYEKESKMDNKINNAMVYPIVLGIVSIGVVVFLLTYVMPTFMTMFESSGTEMPVLTKKLLAVSNIMRNYWYLLLIATTAMIIGLRELAKKEKVENVLETIKLKMPILKNINQIIITSRFTRNLSIVLYSGISIIEALEIVSKVVGNKLVERKLLESREKIMKGISLAETLKDINIFPPMVLAMIKIGEESGSLDSILEKTANFYDEEVETKLSKIATLIEPMMILFMGLIVAFIVVAMILPIFD
ncbi:MAG: type II secretion system F family protein, partial [Clostridiaceae bacterium]